VQILLKEGLVVCTLVETKAACLVEKPPRWPTIIAGDHNSGQHGLSVPMQVQVDGIDDAAEFCLARGAILRQTDSLPKLGTRDGTSLRRNLSHLVVKLEAQERLVAYLVLK
jgi:hypothetical protein